MKRVMIVPEPHFNANNIRSFIDYKGLCDKAYYYIYNLVEKYKPDYLIFPGDIFHLKMTDEHLISIWTQRMENLAKLTEIYSAIGNHELTYQTLFWSLVTQTSNRLRSKRARQPKGENEIIKVRDKLNVEGKVFDFLHYSSQPPLDDLGGIAIVHGDYTCSQIENVNDAVNTHLNFITVEDIGKLLDYERVYIGHMHKNIMTLKVNDCKVTYLGSLLPTNSTEVSKDLENKYIHILDIENNCIVGEKQEIFNIPCADEILVKTKHIEEEKSKKDIKLELDGCTYTASEYINTDQIKAEILSFSQQNEIRSTLLRGLLNNDWQFLRDIEEI